MPNRRLQRIESHLLDEAERVLRISGEDLLSRAATDAPIDTGTLRGSGTLTVDRTPYGVTVTVAFTERYAAKQEVEDTYNHPLGGKSRYLGDQITAMAGRYSAVLRATLGKALS